MLLLHQGDDLFVDSVLGIGRAGQARISAEILVVDRLQGYHVKVLAHAVAGDHCPGELGCLFDIVGRAGGDRPEDQLLRGPSAGVSRDLVLQFFLVHQIVVVLLHLKGISQSAGGAGNNRDFLYGSRVGLFRRNKRMPDLVIGDDFLLVVRENGVFLLVACDDHFNALFQIRLCRERPSVAHGAQRGLVDNIRQFRAGRARRHPRDLQEVHIIRDLDFLRMHLQDGLAPFQVRELHGNTAVKASGPGQGRVQGFGPVCSRQNDDAGVAVEAVHLRQELVERLLPLVISADVASAAALLSDGVDFVDKDDTGGLLLGLAEQIAHLGRAHADEHLDEFRSGHGEEGYTRLARYGLGKHRLAGSRRADQQNAFGHLSPDLAVFLRILQILDDLLEVFLRLVHAFHIAEANTVGRLHINLCVGLAHIEHQGPGASAGLVHHLF